MKKLNQYRRIVIKVGSALLVDQNTGLKQQWLTSLCQDIADLYKDKVEIVLVSSGAIALGRKLLNIPNYNLKLEEAQACASIGQIELSKTYADNFATLGIPTGQILLTICDTEERQRYLNARATIETLLNLGVIPLVNENDTVATVGIRYGDNDRLAARVATMVCADLLIILSDIDGLYSAPPHLNKNAKFLPYIENITPEIEKMAGAAASHLSRGGMKTKLDAGKIVTTAGTSMIIASGRAWNPLRFQERGDRYSLFAAHRQPVNAWKSWISGHLMPAAFLVIDEGAVKALRAGKSLLPAGVTAIKGNFECGDTVAIVDINNKEIARGLVSYNKSDATKIIGLKSDMIEKILPFMRTALVHRNNMVVHK